ncbi:DUF397 domain-containing protein [Actinomadura soli]|uniref:DUF397 domain-containing protein n=1 Tax=Actinomadura soli TaxID=2508997 RepID=A0A5C4JJL2_9ACTN|nr:DUF397 domain-containing protein [Actinomadura soli]TMR05518.1 DUF397 domain-containing protein [Actinomadura soli]
MTSPDLSSAGWRTSRHSQQDGACVEIAPVNGAVAMRDSKDPHGPVLLVPRSAWQAFSRSIKQGEHGV